MLEWTEKPGAKHVHAVEARQKKEVDTDSQHFGVVVKNLSGDNSGVQYKQKVAAGSS